MPQGLRAKLLQLDQAVRHFNDTPDSIIGRGDLMICLNSEKRVCLTKCLAHLKELYSDGKLQKCHSL